MKNTSSRKHAILFVSILMVLLIMGGFFMKKSNLNKDKSSSMNSSNNLKDEKSPYLLQHANNPVNWYPWGEEAFKKAREEDKIIFLSIGSKSPSPVASIPSVL